MTKRIVLAIFAVLILAGIAYTVTAQIHHNRQHWQMVNCPPNVSLSDCERHFGK